MPLSQEQIDNLESLRAMRVSFDTQYERIAKAAEGEALEVRKVAHEALLQLIRLAQDSATTAIDHVLDGNRHVYPCHINTVVSFMQGVSHGFDLLYSPDVVKPSDELVTHDIAQALHKAARLGDKEQAELRQAARYLFTAIFTFPTTDDGLHHDCLKAATNWHETRLALLGK